MTLDSFRRKVEGLGDVLTSIVRSGTRPDILETGVGHLVTIAGRLIELNRADQSAFVRVVVREDFQRMALEKPEEIHFRTALAPEIVLAGYQAPLDQLGRIHVAALDANMTNAALTAAKGLQAVLEWASIEAGSDVLVRMTLSEIQKQASRALRGPGASLKVLGWGWFLIVSVVHPGYGYKPFHTGYLDEFTKALWSNVRRTLDQRDAELFGRFLDDLLIGCGIFFSAIEHVHDPEVRDLLPDDENGTRYWAELAQRFHALSREIREIRSLEDLSGWKARVAIQQRELANALRSGNEEEGDSRLAAWVRQADNVLKARYVSALLSSSGAYCLFRNLPDCLRALLQAAHPEDSDATWIGWNPFPESIDRILADYVLALLQEDIMGWWEGRHGHTRYDEEFAVLLLARELSRIQFAATATAGVQEAEPGSVEEGQALVRFTVTLPTSLNPSQIHGIGALVERLTMAAQRLAGKGNMLAAAGLQSTAAQSVLAVHLPAYLSALKEAAERSLASRVLATDLIPSRIDEFATAVSKGYEENAAIRQLLTKLGHYEDQTGVRPTERQLFGLNTLIDRSAFLDLPFESWSLYEEGLGRNLALSEDEWIIDSLSNACTPFSGDIDQALEASIGGEMVILSARTWDRDSTLATDRFSRLPRNESESLPGQVGWYEPLGRQRIPVIESYHLLDRGTLVVAAERLGELANFDPTPDDCPSARQHGVLAICVSEVSDAPELRDQVLSEQPQWLVNRPAGIELTEGLRFKVWLRVLESFRYAPGDDPGLLLIRDAEASSES